MDRAATGTSGTAAAASSSADAPRVFLVCPRYAHHAAHSGYEGFRRHLRCTHLKSPVRKRFLGGRWGQRFDRWFEHRAKRPDYNFSLLVMEAAAGLHALFHRGCVYHFLYGDHDYWMLGSVARRTGNAVVASFHETEDTLHWHYDAQRFCRDLTAVILLGEAQRPYFERFLPPERIFVVRHGVDTDFFTPPARPSGNRTCITVGGHQRDFRTLNEAVRLVRERDPRVRFVAIGTHVGHDGEPLAADGVELRNGLTDEELRQAYQEATLAAFSFKSAIANNSVLESMASGLPIVATAVGGVPEYVGTDGGILCAPNDPVAMADAMLRILDDPRRAAEMGAAARRRALQLDFRIVAEQLREVYGACLRLERDRK